MTFDAGADADFSRTMPSLPLMPLAAPSPRPLSEATDGELARALIDNEPRALHVAWQRFHPLVSGIARRMLGPYGDVEDAVQEVFVRLLRGVRALREPEALRAFVITVTSRTLGHERRRQRARLGEMADVDNIESLAHAAHADPEAKNAWIRVQSLLGRLRARDRRAFVLYFLEGMNAPEVARTLGVSVPTARRSLGHARRRIDCWARRDPFLVDYLARYPVPQWDTILGGLDEGAAPHDGAV